MGPKIPNRFQAAFEAVKEAPTQIVNACAGLNGGHITRDGETARVEEVWRGEIDKQINITMCALQFFWTLRII